MQASPGNIEWGAMSRKKTCYGDGIFPTHEERFKLIDRSLWQPISLSRHVSHIYSQADGMCTANGAVQCMMVERDFRNRPRNPLLSPEYLYGQVARWGQGSSLDEILRALVDGGCCTWEQVPQAGGHLAKSWPEDHETLAAENRVLEWIDLNADFDAVATSLQHVRPVLGGVRWDGDPRKGHAICVTELVQFTRVAVARLTHLGWNPPRGLEYDTWGCRGPNSWDETWGEEPGYTDDDLRWLESAGREPLTGGWYTLTESECRDFRDFGCWAVGAST